MSEPTAYRYRHNSWPDWHYITVSEAEGEYAPDRLRQLFDQSEPLYTEPEPDEEGGEDYDELIAELQVVKQEAREAKEALGLHPKATLQQIRDAGSEERPRGDKDLRDQIEDALRDYRTHHLRYEGDGGGMQLIDALSPDGGSVGPGKEEIELLADEIAYRLVEERPGGSGEAGVLPSRDWMRDRVDEATQEIKQVCGYDEVLPSTEAPLCRALIALRRLRSNLDHPTPDSEAESDE